MKFYLAIFAFFALSLPTFAQTNCPAYTSGVLASARVVDWCKVVGLPATITYGTGGSACTGGTGGSVNCVETLTPMISGSGAPPYLPPTRTQCGATLTPSGGNDETQVLSALSACKPGSYVLLAPGNWSFTTSLFLSPGYTGNNGLSVRGSGPMSTFLTLTASYIHFGATSGGGSATASSGLSLGSTSVVVGTPSGSAPTVGNLAWFTQCDTGFTGGSCAGGSATDNGGLFVVADNSCCDTDSPNANVNTYAQQQTVLITSVSPTGCASGCTVGFSNGLYMPNWATASNATLNWNDSSYLAKGMGLEDMTIITPHSSASEIEFDDAYASWTKGIRWIGSPSTGFPIALINASKNLYVANNYFFGENPGSFDSSGWTITFNGSSTDSLVLNNITAFGLFMENAGKNESTTIAYNFNRDAESGGYQPVELQHEYSPAFLLFEGNQLDRMIEDNTWTSHAFDTFERNYMPCWDTPFQVTGNQGGGLQIGSYARFDNSIANAIGDTSTFGQSICSTYIKTAGGDNYMFSFAGSGEPTQGSPINEPSAMLWGNCDTVNNTCRFQSSEVPTNLSTWPNSVAFENSVPSSHTIPVSFFLPITSAYPSGGTGLTWWKVCTNWTTLWTGCSATQAQPFPTVGPDVTGGPYVNGAAYDAPAAVAYKYLPIDTTYQSSYTITGSSWAGSVETLTVGLPVSNHTMGGFQMSGVNAACIPSGINFSNVYGNNEVFMTSSTSTTITYALASNPGVSCTGTMKWPDVRQFDERVYQNDPPAAATGPTMNGAFKLTGGKLN